MLIGKLIRYLKNNLWQGLRTSPFRGPLCAWALVPVFGGVAFAVGFPTGLLRFAPLTGIPTPSLTNIIYY
jgi:hypothetical protein